MVAVREVIIGIHRSSPNYEASYCPVARARTAVELWEALSGLSGVTAAWADDCVLTVLGGEMVGISAFNCGVEPRWEDGAMAGGMILTAALRKQQAYQVFESALLYQVAGASALAASLLGVRLMYRMGQYKVEFWFRDKLEEAAMLEHIGADCGAPLTISKRQEL